MTNTQITVRAVRAVKQQMSQGLAVGKTDMASKMWNVAAFFLLFSLYVCYGADPQPQQIHISATGKERRRYPTVKS